MKIHPLTLPIGIQILLNLSLIGAEAFDSGSTGAYGPLNITTNGGSTTTLDMPPDGVFHCTTITIAQGATLRFNRNLLNTPVYLLATGDVAIIGTIDVSGGPASGNMGGEGGPGGYDGGPGVVPPRNAPGDGLGPGKGLISVNNRGASFGSPGNGGINTNTYGNLLLFPLIGGSGGGGCNETGGGGGGGAILIASKTKIILTGSVKSDGGNGLSAGGYTVYSGSGSGGAIRLVAPFVTGMGSLFVNGGGGGEIGGFGRIRVDTSNGSTAWRQFNHNGIASGGARMVVIPPNTPRLDVIAVGGTAIPEGATEAAYVHLPAGSSTNQTVRVQARNFTNDVPIRVTITPDFGNSAYFDSVINMSSGNPPTATVNIVIPVDMNCHIHVWSR